MDLLQPFDPEEFRRRGHQLIDTLAGYLQTCSDRTVPQPVLPAVGPAAHVAALADDFAVPQSFDDLIAYTLRYSNKLHHPRYMGHQVTSPLPDAALLHLVSTLLNNGSAIFEMGPVSLAMERRVVQWMGRKLGFGGGADGVLTSGGSAGNLTALLAMRQAQAGFDVWREGCGSGPGFAVLTSDQTHYSVTRAAHLLGWGDDSVVLVPSDARFKVRTEALAAGLEAAQQRGRKVLGVVGSACSTATGAVDDLSVLADFAAAHKLWFHVDGAHGASFVLTERGRALCRGIERADSVVWDAHKMLLAPALTTAVIFRDGRHSYESFAQKAAYLFDEGEPDERNWWDVGQRTLECTKNMMGFVLYSSLALRGEAYFTAYLDAMLDRTAAMARLVAGSDDFELAAVPEANILCFRYRPAGEGAGSALDQLQRRLRQEIVAGGRFYIVQTALRGEQYLRLTIINPRTTVADFKELLAAIRGMWSNKMS